MLLCLLQELFTFSKCVTNTFETLPHSKSFVYRAQSSVKLIWCAAPPAIASCLMMADPHCRKVLFNLLFRDRKEEVDWQFMIHFLEETLVSVGSTEPAAVMPCRGSFWAMTSVCTLPRWQSSQSGQLEMGYLDLESDCSMLPWIRKGGRPGISKTLNEEFTPWDSLPPLLFSTKSLLFVSIINSNLDGGSTVNFPQEP